MSRAAAVADNVLALAHSDLLTRSHKDWATASSICRSIVAAHGGDLRAVNNPARSVFVALPIDLEGQA